jgi:hypothetical protein
MPVGGPERLRCLAVCSDLNMVENHVESTIQVLYWLSECQLLLSDSLSSSGANCRMGMDGAAC